jgi:hypothetical protein
MSVKTSLQMEICISVPTKFVSLTVLRENARGRKKPGRKHPRPGDIEYDYPEDSAVKKIKPDVEKVIVSEDSPIKGSSVDVGNVRASVEAVGATITEELLGRIKGTVDNR